MVVIQIVQHTLDLMSPSNDLEISNKGYRFK